MILNLFWKDIEGNSYKLGSLYKQNNIYYFDINEEQLKEATHKGCFGIGDLNLLYNHHKSEELFSFFQNRIPAKDSQRAKNIMKIFELEEYDEIQLLKNTKGRLNTDRYFMEEQK